MGLYSALEGMGSLLGIALVQLAVSLRLDWITNENQFNQGHLDYFYYLLAVIEGLVIIILGTVIYVRCGSLVSSIHSFLCDVIIIELLKDWSHLNKIRS